jgi:hypothetical protein
VPADALTTTAQLSYARVPSPGELWPPVANLTSGFGTFFLDATDSLSQTVH